MLKVIAAAALALLAVAAAAQGARPVQVPCERACMENLAGQLLDALAAHDASRLPLSPTARYTELGQAMGFDNGLWQTASRVGAYRHVIADPASGQFGLYATLDEQGHGVTLGARVRIEQGWISEVEVVAYRVGAGPAWNDGTYTTNRPGLIRMGDVDIGGMGCKAQFSTGLYGVITEVHDRRFPIVDEERQAVFAFAVFDHCGCKRELTMPDGRVVPIAGFNRPSSILLAEAFAIRGDLIEQVEAVGNSVPYHSDTGWGR